MRSFLLCLLAAASHALLITPAAQLRVVARSAMSPVVMQEGEPKKGKWQKQKHLVANAQHFRFLAPKITGPSARQVQVLLSPRAAADLQLIERPTRSWALGRWQSFVARPAKSSSPVAI